MTHASQRFVAQHDVRELWSVDRDFNRFAGLAAVNPPVRD